MLVCVLNTVQVKHMWPVSTGKHSLSSLLTHTYLTFTAFIILHIPVASPVSTNGAGGKIFFGWKH